MTKDHCVYAIGNRDDGSKLLVVGLTADALDVMATGRNIPFEIPAGMRNIASVIVFAEPTLADLRQKFIDTGLPITGFPS